MEVILEGNNTVEKQIKVNIARLQVQRISLRNAEAIKLVEKHLDKYKQMLRRLNSKVLR